MAQQRGKGGSRTESTAARQSGAASRRIRITQVRSEIGYARAQRAVLRGLGLLRRGRTVVLEDTPSIRGMVAKIPHLLEVADEVEA